ncbi:hypothetical protein V1387_13705 [Allomuricauda taeanensis]|uniref:hypothetical protein n=1 Tax=Flagellimonas taeanensis TaxID=1005926 RepID=UPI002E7C4151|nr:hypothetical protein [Allomuricauda taeanensis]MEE1963747.1 hypothetical protein [Allomuricauda taeanensis]
MYSFYFYSKQFLKILERNNEILDLIFSIDNLRTTYIINPQEIIDVGTNNTSQVNGMARLQSSIKQKNIKVLEVVRSMRPNEVYKLINSLISDLNLFDSAFNDDDNLIVSLKEFPDKHTDAYSEKQASHIFALIENTDRIAKSIKALKSRALYIVQKSEESDKKSPIDYLPLRIGADQDVPLIEDFVSIFTDLEALYNFICFLHKIDSEKKPLIVNQISTGSWYTELLGIKQTIISIENLLKGIGSFIRDYITGKIDREKFENECKKAEAFIYLMKIAEENGIKNAELGVFKKLNPFIDNLKKDTTTIVEVNEEEILKLRRLDKLTLLDNKKKRQNLLENINLAIEEGDKKFNNDKTK